MAMPFRLRLEHAPGGASAVNISAFTRGSAIGIYLGGTPIDGGLGLALVNWVGGLLTSAGLITALVAWAVLDRRRPVQVHPVLVVHHHH
ncbi:hypothetical protein ACFLIM_05500 [Nonomuraea sp. M3C6]|uniref:MFS transporter n=1 Tax=Nonomuraea marmarensis TaxID=3351344 RepID=A0ABW7A8K4_9ACTN